MLEAISTGKKRKLFIIRIADYNCFCPIISLSVLSGLLS